MGLFDDILSEILGMLKEQVFAFNETVGNSSESRLQVSSGISTNYRLDGADIVAAYYASGRVQPERVLL